MNPVKLYMTLAFSLTLHAASAAMPSPLLLFRLENNETICIGAAEEKSSRQCGHFISSKDLDKGIRKLFRQSEELSPAFSQPSVGGNYLVLIARVPSRIPQGSGYCGAGYEDYAILLELRNRNITLLDDFLLQSCLKSISLDSDGGGDILKALSVDRHTHSIGFRWATDPSNQSRTLTIANEKFLLK